MLGTMSVGIVLMMIHRIIYDFQLLKAVMRNSLLEGVSNTTQFCLSRENVSSINNIRALHIDFGLRSLNVRCATNIAPVPMWEWDAWN